MGSSVVQGGDLGAQMIAGKPPRYPVESRRKREQGTVVLALTLGLDGAVESLSIARSSGFPRLDNAARDALRSEEHTSELQSLMRISYAVFCLTKKPRAISATHKSHSS